MNTTPLFLAGVFGLGGPELILIMGVLLLLFGGSKLPELAKGLGKSIKEFKHASRDDAPPEPVSAANVPAAPSPEPAAATTTSKATAAATS